MSGETRHFVDLWGFDGPTLRAILDEAKARKARRVGRPKGEVDADRPAEDRTLAMIFEKNSTRTRFSFHAAMRQLGGASLIANAGDMQLGRGESIGDTAQVLSRMVDAIMIRADEGHADVAAMAVFRLASVPVINGLSDRGHPCQIIADLDDLRGTSRPVADRQDRSPGSAMATMSAQASSRRRSSSASG